MKRIEYCLPMRPLVRHGDIPCDGLLREDREEVVEYKMASARSGYRNVECRLPHLLGCAPQGPGFTPPIVQRFSALPIPRGRVTALWKVAAGRLMSCDMAGQTAKPYNDTIAAQGGSQYQAPGRIRHRYSQVAVILIQVPQPGPRKVSGTSLLLRVPLVAADVHKSLNYLCYRR